MQVILKTLAVVIPTVRSGCWKKLTQRRKDAKAQR